MVGVAGGAPAVGEEGRGAGEGAIKEVLHAQKGVLYRGKGRRGELFVGNRGDRHKIYILKKTFN